MTEHITLKNKLTSRKYISVWIKKNIYFLHIRYWSDELSFEIFLVIIASFFSEMFYCGYLLGSKFRWKCFFTIKLKKWKHILTLFHDPPDPHTKSAVPKYSWFAPKNRMLRAFKCIQSLYEAVRMEYNSLAQCTY